MGWSYMHNPVARSEVKATIRSEFSQDAEVLKDVIVGNVYYAAVRSKIDNVTVGVVVLFTNTKRDGFGTKMLDETCGPLETECPESILDLLVDPPLNHYAAMWRERCRKHHQKRAVVRSLKRGDTVTFNNPLTFAAYGQRKVFKVVRKTSTYAPVFTPVGEFFECRISRLTHRDFTVAPGT